MRLFNFSLLFGAAALVTAGSAAEDSDDSAAAEGTFFNQKPVPPMLELTPDNWEEESKASKYLLVKHYSPYCHHCINFAPTYQTLYEFYYTSTPSGSESKDVDFTSFYGFRFAAINCVAYYDLCGSHDVTSWPTTILYKDGVEVEKYKGVKNMEYMSKAVEGILEKEKPGTRPATLSLPEPGAKSMSGGTAEPELQKPVVGDKEKDTAKVKTGNKEKDTSKLKVSEKEKDTSTSKTSDKEKGEKVLAAEDADAKSAKETSPPAKYADIQYTPPTVKKPSKSSATPNPNGISVSLTPESFQTLVTMTQDPWFIKFYAPWCHHCQAMAPAWEQLAKQMKGLLNVGEVNCDAESRLCKEAHLKGYPTILFFKGGERVEYEGLRGLGDFIHYADKAIDVSSGVQDVDAASFKALEEKEEVIFVYFYDHATTSEDFMALERLPLSLIGHAKLVKTRDPVLYERFKISTWPRLVVSREGRPTYYNPLTPNQMRDVQGILNWMKSVWLPIVPELTASNAREIMDGKIVVLGILNREDQESFTGAIREMKSAAAEWMDKQIQLFQLERQELRDAKQLRIEEAEDRGDQRALRNAKLIRISMDRADRKEVGFAWVDGVFWQRWIRTTYGVDVKDGERVIINDEDNRRYWDQTITGNPITPSRTSILETINKVTQSPPKIKPKLTISSFEKIFFDMRVTFTEHPYLTTGCILGLALGGASWFRGRMRRTRGGHFRLDDTMKEFKGPLLGGNTNGKVD